MPQSDIGLIGLGVMGRNLALNINDHGFKVTVYNRTRSIMEEFIQGEAQNTNIQGATSLEELSDSLKKPRRVMLMISAGPAVDKVIESLLPHLEQGDIIIDGGNSNFHDTIRRTEYLESKGLRFVGAGISGGEEGARYGPSIMPGGSQEAWPHIKEILQSIAAKVDDGTPCCDWVGSDGAGHFVKMVHNGIEYGDMQLISESYHLRVLDSFLIEITGDILAFKDQDGEPLLEKILDSAGQKGTGRWTAINALEAGVPLTMIAEAVMARTLSALKEERVKASRSLKGPELKFDGDQTSFVEDIRQALYAAKIISYTQGYMLFREAADEYDWDLDYGGIALMWREGCIIRSAFLGDIQAAYEKNPELVNLLLDPYFRAEVESALDGWRRVVSQAAIAGIPTPAMSSALAFYDGYRHERLPANMIQAQRDYFGAHTYQRVDRPRGKSFHTDWIGSGEENPVD